MIEPLTHPYDAESSHDPDVIGPEIFGEVTLEPNEKAEVFIGIYEDNMPQPVFVLEYSTAAHDTIIAQLVKEEEPGSYTLLYKLHNRGRQACHVTIRNGEWLN